MSNILVSGGLGFIGSHLVDELVFQGHNIVVIDDLSTGNIKNLNKNVVLYKKNINDNLDDIFYHTSFDYVFHLAAKINLRESIKSPKDYFKTNVTGSINLIDCCIKHKIKKFIFSSTGGAIYDPLTTMPWNEQSLANPASPYGLSKLVIENYLKMAKELYGLRSCSLRYSNVFGARQYGTGSGIISIVINKALNNKEIVIFGDGEQSRDFIHVSDVVSANIAAMNLEGVHNVSSGETTSINEIVKIVCNKLEHDNIVYKDKINGELLTTKLSSSLLQSFGWNPKIKTEDGINKTIEWHLLDK